MPKIVDHQLRRNEISAIAARLIAKDGLEAATIREIAQRSGYSKGVVEHYFENKDELIGGALNWANQRYEKRVDEVTAGLSGLAALRKRLEATFPLDQATRDEWKVRLVFWSIASIQPELRKRQEQRFKKAVDYFEHDIVTAIDAGEIDKQVNTKVQARRLLNMATGISCAALYNHSLYNKNLLLAEIDYLVDHAARGH